jgi:hypothetical protein
MFEESTSLRLAFFLGPNIGIFLNVNEQDPPTMGWKFSADFSLRHAPTDASTPRDAINARS